MNNNFDNILPNNSNNNPDRLQELNDALNSDDATFENEHDFETDAAVGLKQIPQENISAHVSALNKALKQQLKKKKKRKIPDQTMLYITIVTLLILIVVAYIVIKKIIA